MAGRAIDPSRAPVAFGRWAVPQLFEGLQRPEADARQRALTSLCDLLHNPENVAQAVNGGNVSPNGFTLKQESLFPRLDLGDAPNPYGSLCEPTEGRAYILRSG